MLRYLKIFCYYIGNTIDQPARFSISLYFMNTILRQRYYYFYPNIEQKLTEAESLDMYSNKNTLKGLGHDFS